MSKLIETPNGSTGSFRPPICKGDSTSTGAESGTNSGNNGGSDNYGSESYP